MTYASGAIQTGTIGVNPALGVPGELYDTDDVVKVSRIANVAIPFGAYVKSIANGKCDLPSASGDIEADKGGVALYDPNKQSGVGYEIGDVVTVLHRGKVWVQSDGAITELTVPFVRYTAGSGGTAGTVPGGWSGATDAGKNLQPAAGVVALTGTAGAGPIVVDINFPQ